MADNYLEKRYEEVFGGAGNASGAKYVKRGRSLDELLLASRSYRGYDKGYVVARRQLETIASVNTRIPSAKNKQTLRFKLVCREDGADKVFAAVRFGGISKDFPLPVPGTEPEAFIVVCCTGEETASVDIDLGISLQSMMLKAVEIGLNGIILRMIDREALKRDLGLQYEPVAVCAFGKGIEHIELKPVAEGESLHYYRENGTHFVPKLTMKDLII